VTAVRGQTPEPAAHGTAHAVVGLSIILSWATLAAVGQPATSPTSRPSWTVHIAAEEQTLWVAAADGQRSLVYRRGANEAFQALDPLNAPIATTAVSGSRLYAFMDDGAFYSLGRAGWSRELDLPRREKPPDLVGDETGVYALTVSPPPGQMQRVVGTGRTATTEPFDAGEAPLSLVRYDSQGWVALAPCPERLFAASRQNPQLAIVYGVPCLLWHSEETQRIECLRLNAETGDWRPGPATPALATPEEFWVATISRVPTMLVATATEGGPSLAALRLLGGLDGTANEWRPATLDLSALPAGVPPKGYDVAFGFNQHAVFLMVDRSDTPYLRYGRVDASPTEVTTSVADVLSGQRGTGQALPWLQGTTLVALVGLLLALFVFRRGAMVAVLTLPEDCALALAAQRLLGLAIDLVPFAAAAAIALGVDWQSALRELGGWASGGGAPGGKLPAAGALLWWGASCGTYTVYGLVMELLTRRTVGKVLVGTRLLAETGGAPRPWQIVVRNLLRCVELMPPFWVLGFVVVLSRNRQRVGDIFARTIVVRRARRTLDRP